MPFAPYVEPVQGDQFSAKDAVGHTVVVKALERKNGVITTNSPEGTDAVAADLVDLDAAGGPALLRGALIFGGAMVDGLAPYVGKDPVVITIAMRNSKAGGRQYPVPVAADAAGIARAEALWAAKGDPFATRLATIPAPAPAPVPAPTLGDPWATAPAPTQPAQAPAADPWAQAPVHSEPPFSGGLG